MRRLLLIGIALAACGQPGPLQTVATRYEGVVVDADTGSPIPGAVVTTIHSRYIPAPEPKATTDPEGRFTIEIRYAGVPQEDLLLVSTQDHPERPLAIRYGEYLPSDDRNVVRRRVVLRMVSPATILGVVTDSLARTVAKSPVTLVPLAGHAIRSSYDLMTDGEGRFEVKARPGSYLLCAGPSDGPKPGWGGLTRALSSVPVATCFPSASDYATATVIQAGPGQKIGPLTVRLIQERTYSVRGRIDSAAAHKGAWGASIDAIPVVRFEDGLLDTSPWVGCVHSDGRFSIAGLIGGTYTLRVEAGEEVPGQKCGALPDITPTDDCCSLKPRPPRPPVYATSRTLDLRTNVQGLVLTPGSHATIYGHLIFPDGKPGQLQTFELASTLTVHGRSLEGPALSFTGDVSGGFQIEDWPAGEYRLRMPPERNYIAGIRQDGREAAEGRVRIEAGKATHLEITAKKARAMLRIHLAGPTEPKPVAVVVIPEPPWIGPATPETCLVRGEGPVERGPLAPGAYLVYAAYCVSDLDQLFPLGAQRLAGPPVRVTLGETETKDVDVTPVRLNP